jgi:hypothetical protein
MTSQKMKPLTVRPMAWLAALSIPELSKIWYQLLIEQTYLEAVPVISFGLLLGQAVRISPFEITASRFLRLSTAIKKPSFIIAVFRNFSVGSTRGRIAFAHYLLGAVVPGGCLGLG